MLLHHVFWHWQWMLSPLSLLCSFPQPPLSLIKYDYLTRALDEKYLPLFFIVSIHLSTFSYKISSVFSLMHCHKLLCIMKMTHLECPGMCKHWKEYSRWLVIWWNVPGHPESYTSDRCHIQNRGCSWMNLFQAKTAGPACWEVGYVTISRPLGFNWDISAYTIA